MSERRDRTVYISAETDEYIEALRRRWALENRAQVIRQAVERAYDGVEEGDQG